VMLSREFLIAVLLVSSVCPNERLDTHDPDTLLKRAERLAWLTDWYTAAPIYRSAESGFHARGDARGAMYAKFGRIRGEMQTLPLAEISNEIGTDLNSPLARNDQRLRLRGLTIKGDIDLEWNVAAAQDDWEQARRLAMELGESAWEHRATGELGMIAFMRGDTGEARKLVEQAFRAAWWSDDVGAQLRYMGSIANGLLQAGYPESAMGWVDKALAFSQKHPDTGFPYVVRSTQALALLRLNRAAEAERVINEALVYARAGDRRIKQVELLLMLADIATKQHRPEESLAHLEEAVSRARSGDVRRLLGDAEGDLAHAYRERGDFAIAERYASEAIAHTEASGNQFALPGRLAALAEIDADQNKLAQADRLYQQAADIVEGVMLHVPSSAAQARLIGVTSDVYTGHFRVAAAQRNVAKAFTILERARGRAIADMLRASSHREQTSAAALEQMREVSALQIRLLKTTAPSERRTLLDELWQVEEDMLPERTASRAALATNRTPVTLPELQQTLAPDETVLEYLLDEPTSYCLVVSRHAKSLVTLPSRRQLERLSDTFVKSLRASARAGEAATALYRAALTPVLPRATMARLIIVPDGRLHLVPFDTLLNLNGNEPRSVTTSPSAGVLCLLRRSSKTETRPPRSLLAVGGVPYDSTLKPSMTLAAVARSDETRGLYDAALPSKLPPLPMSRSEVITAARLMGPTSVALAGEQATESALKAQKLEDFDVLHFAVHGISDPKSPERAALVLLPDAQAGEDGLLQPREISRLALNARVVVLSACNTAVGPTIGQEGVLNLARAFLVAGARSIVTTLWTVSDATSSALMARFYERLASGEDVGDAMTQAKKAVIQQFGVDALPTVAAFQIVGAADTVTSRKPFSPLVTRPSASSTKRAHMSTSSGGNR